MNFKSVFLQFFESPKEVIWLEFSTLINVQRWIMERLILSLWVSGFLLLI